MIQSILAGMAGIYHDYHGTAMTLLAGIDYYDTFMTILAGFTGNNYLVITKLAGIIGN